MTEHDPEFPYVIKDHSGKVFAKFHKRERHIARWFAENHPLYKEVIDTTPKPTLREQFDALPVGTVFTWGGEARIAVKVSRGKLFDFGDVVSIEDYSWDSFTGDLEVLPVD